MKIDQSKLSPMMKKYIETKDEYPDCILFYRLGDFYEMFFDDALLASKVLGITLTGKACGLEERAPMCGVPFHSASSYISKLIEAGYKVAIGEQVEDPATTKGLVRREVVKVVTPGTLIEEDDLENNRNNYLMTIFFEDELAALSYVDISTGELNATKIDREHVKDEIAKISPSEIITNDLGYIEEIESLCTMANIYVNRDFDNSLLDEEILLNIFSKEYLLNAGIYGNPLFEKVISIALNYIKKTQKLSSTNISSINIYNSHDYMVLDMFTRVNLELTQTMRGAKKKGSLLEVLDETKTPMGSRMIRKFIEQPLINKEKIDERLNITEDIYNSFILREELKDRLSHIFDLERICAKIAYDRANAKDLINLKNSIEVIPSIIETIENSDSDILKKFISNVDPLEDIFTLINDSIKEEPAQTIKEGNIIKSEFSKELAELRDISENGAYIIKEIENREREKLDIKTLKIKFNKVFGYFIEITKVALAQCGELDDSYERRQTLVNAERFITPELKEIEEKIINAEDKINILEYDIFREIRLGVYNNIERIQRVASIIAELDVYLSNAIVANKYNYVKPKINTKGYIDIVDGRHPVIERIMGEENFISNNTYIDKKNQVNIITGPNMSGKSTYMRQTALIALMAHIGCFVPASKADLPILDRIFTRVGASDDLAQGQSTFMVEMDEVSQILKNATKDSLIILDEVGRGTSTYDGISLAWSIVEYIHDRIFAKTLFATHYHELTDLENKYDNIKNYSVEVKEDGENVVFLRKMVPQAADRSYGIYVAKLAKLPDEVISRADNILSELEKNHLSNSSSIEQVQQVKETVEPIKEEVQPKEEIIEQPPLQDTLPQPPKKGKKKRSRDHIVEEAQLTFEDLKENGYVYEEFVKYILKVDLMNSTPLECMNKMHDIQNRAKKLKKL